MEEPAAAPPSTDDAAVQLTTLARELRESRALLGLSQAALSKASGVSRTVINKIEAGARVPSVRTYARLRETLGLEAPAAGRGGRRLPRRLEDSHLTALCAAIVVTQTATLVDLASALDISVPAIRENLDAVVERLRPVGFWLTDDGGSVRLWPLPGTPTDVVRTLTTVEEDADPSAEQLEILTIVAFFGRADRSLIERCRAGEESASLLDRMTRGGLLAKVRSDRGAGGPNVYSVSTKALRAAGFATVEAMRAAVVKETGGAELALLASQLSMPAG